MRIIGTILLNRIAKEEKVTSPKEILERMRTGVLRLMGQDKDATRRDSMDMSLVTIDREKQEVFYAGAYNSLYHISNNELNEIKADKMPVGHFEYANNTTFTEHKINFEPGDMIHLFSNGFADQFGSLRDKKYSSKRMKEFLLSVAQLSVIQQKNKIEKEFVLWKGANEQIDDVITICIKL